MAEIKQDQQSNHSWSRIRIIMPDSSRSHFEQPKASTYLAICDIGGMMGVYAGFSMITFAQILAYGVNIAWFKREERKARAASLQSHRKKSYFKKENQDTHETPC